MTSTTKVCAAVRVQRRVLRVPLAYAGKVMVSIGKLSVQMLPSVAFAPAPSPGGPEPRSNQNRGRKWNHAYSRGVAGDDGGAAFGHIVYAHGPCAVFGRTGRTRCGHVIALGHGRPISTGSARPGKRIAEMKRFAGLADQHRISSGAEGLESRSAAVGCARCRAWKPRPGSMIMRSGFTPAASCTPSTWRMSSSCVGQYAVLVDGGLDRVSRP